MAYPTQNRSIYTPNETEYQEECAWINSLGSIYASGGQVNRRTIDSTISEDHEDSTKEIQSEVQLKAIIKIIDALYPKEGNRLGQLDSPIQQSAKETLKKRSRLSDACCNLAASTVRSSINRDIWQNPSETRDLIRSELKSQMLPRDIGYDLDDFVAIISDWIVHQEMTSLKVAFIYRIRLGSTEQQDDKILELSREIGSAQTIQRVDDGPELTLAVIFDPGCECDVSQAKLKSMAELGSKPIGLHTRTMTLPGPFDETYTTFKVSDEELSITILPSSELNQPPWIDEKAYRSLQWILKNMARCSCVISWPPGKLEILDLPQIPPQVGILKMSGMSHFLSKPVPPKEYAGFTPGINKLKLLLENVNVLYLLDCGHDPQDIEHLREWLPLTIMIDSVASVPGMRG